MNDREAGMLKECVDRITRIETRLIVLGLKLGYDLAESDKIVVDGDVLALKAVDVTMSNIIRAARMAGMHGDDVDVYFKGALLATVKV